MFSLYSYLKALPVDKRIVKEVYRITGLRSLEELLDNIRDVEYPCLAVDLGNDGALSLQEGVYDKCYHTLYVIFQAEGTAPAEQIEQILGQAKKIGLQILKTMHADSLQPSDACYGFDSASIHYSRFGPIGMQGYGYSFSFVMNRDHESE